MSPRFGGIPSTARLCRLRFADVAFHDDHAVLDTTSEGCPEQVIVMALPGDAACLVAALKSLRETRYCAMLPHRRCVINHPKADTIPESLQ